jgi:hypothetical protein
MSKVITKKELDLVIESTLEEAGLVSEETLCEECQGEGCESCEDKETVGEEENSKPDFLDLDNDNDKEESMKKASKDKKEALKEELNKFNKIINY